jgi:hypothetical protein
MTTFTIKHLRNSTLSGQEAAFSKDRVLLGRREGADVLFDAHRDPLVSGAHAEVRLGGGRVIIQDLGSSNGTFVNGKRISTPTALGPGDTVSLGAGGPEFKVVLPAPPRTTCASGRGAGPGAGPCDRTRCGACSGEASDTADPGRGAHDRGAPACPLPRPLRRRRVLSRHRLRQPRRTVSRAFRRWRGPAARGPRRPKARG